ncbi:hypothetical protein [Nocardia rhizosphaerihabitans]|uniref:Uncharacterized protein n=1 Tax=Nocardia rhizosphaerihabitans TaxID=1691570 RepID=A0ABQ2K7V0_9NOCA|nr:hypothetical protein [Nocardia rhizosphaerihabitans]GGN73041.1 hypothetical protein GCM10011610_14990 [Nocardia rhizosphaerihabitans]
MLNRGAHACTSLSLGSGMTAEAAVLIDRSLRSLMRFLQLGGGHSAAAAHNGATSTFLQVKRKQFTP